jgi:hypothetical protein
MMSVHKKLMQARLELQKRDLKKSGNNKFAGYKYFELGDFLPAVQEIFAELGLCGVVSFGTEAACLCITDTDDGSELRIHSPMSSAALKGCHEVQNLGAVQTYLRRYLWVTAMEIVEHDALDSSEPLKPEAKFIPAKDAWSGPNMSSQRAQAPGAPAKKTVEGNGGQWNIKISDEHDGNGWAAAAKQGAEMALELAQTADDVLQIFKTNRTIFEQLKDADAGMHADLMDKFKEAKSKFQGE